MDNKISDLYDDFAKGLIDRRSFVRKLVAFAGGAAAAATFFPLLGTDTALAQQVAADDSKLETGYINYPAATGEMKAYQAIPKSAAKLPGVIVIHENRGLNPHTEDVARRFALEGYIAIAPDALSPKSGTPEDSDQARTQMRELDRDQTIKNYVAAVEYLKTHERSTGKVGCTGFCWGGGMTNQVAVNSADLTAAVPFYGSQPAPEDVPKIKASVMAHYGGNDARINAGIEAFETAMKKAGVDYQIFVYEGAGHAFFNDSRAERYHKEASELAWKRTIEFFKEKLKT